MAEVQLAGYTYRTGRLNAIQQWEIFRRLGPVLPMLSAAFRDGAEATPGARWIMGAVTGQLSQLAQADSDYILQASLAVVERLDPTVQRWFRVSAANGTSSLMYQDIDLLTMLELMDQVLQENMAGFFARLRTATDTSETQTAETEPGLPALPTGLH
jgi:hypothetical protein